jgi:fumarylacetoacetase
MVDTHPCNDPTLQSWVPVPEASDFPIQNLPFGIFSPAGGGFDRVGVAIGEHVVDLNAVEEAGLLPAFIPPRTFSAPTLNAFFALGRPAWSEVRDAVSRALRRGSSLEQDGGRVLHRQDAVAMRLPFAVADYADFYSSEHHATNLGRLFRPDAEPLLPNWKHLPVGYHGRAGTVVVSGTPVARPCGLRLIDGAPAYGPSRQLDIELEVGAVVGAGSRGGGPIAPDAAADHVVGLVLLNDWSARDIQAFEYQPLGPFLGKSFATTISPWVVTLDALEPYLVAPPDQQPPPAAHLAASRPWGVDLHLEVDLNGTTVSRTSFREMYWTFAQQLAHATSNGATARTGDLLGSGTVSGPTPGSEGSLIELARRGERPLSLADGSTRSFLADGDTVVLRGWCGGDDPARPRIGFGRCAGTIEQATTRER